MTQRSSILAHRPSNTYGTKLNDIKVQYNTYGTKVKHHWQKGQVIHMTQIQLAKKSSNTNDTKVKYSICGTKLINIIAK